MGARGPSPKPTAMKKRAGNPGKRKLPKKEPQAPATAPTRPGWLSPAAAIEWDRITPILDRMGLLSVADQVSLAGYCQAAAELQLATEELEAVGRYQEVKLVDKKGRPTGITRISAHPALKSQRDAFARLKAFLQEFGLSPSARARLGNASGGEESDELGSLILKLQGGKAA